MGPRIGLDVLEKGIISPVSGFEHQTVRFIANCYTAYDNTTCLVFLCGKTVFVLLMSIDVLSVSYRGARFVFSVPYFLLHIVTD